MRINQSAPIVGGRLGCLAGVSEWPIPLRGGEEQTSGFSGKTDWFFWSEVPLLTLRTFCALSEFGQRDVYVQALPLGNM